MVGDAIVEITVEGDGWRQLQECDTSYSSTAVEAKAVVNNTGNSVVAGRVLAMPSVRQYARDKGVDIYSVVGSDHTDILLKRY